VLLRFIGALAGTRATVLVPEIPEWRDLYLAPDEAIATVRASVRHLIEEEGIHAGSVGVMGFSLGVPQVLRAAADPGLTEKLGGVAGFGGYGTLEPTIQFLFNGEHEWEGTTHTLDPDPYGRWIVGGNYLPEVPGFEDAGDVAEALLRLARKAGDLQVGAWEDHYDGIKDELEKGVDPDRRELFRAFAPPAGRLPPPGISESLTPKLARAARASTPFAEPIGLLDRIRVPVRLVHGWGDRLIPYSESLRIGEAFPERSDVKVYLTGLFSHSQAARGGRKNPLEQIRFLRILADLLSLV
jgi:pimeloyl-ACP methyl ester carboxylesterase